MKNQAIRKNSTFLSSWVLVFLSSLFKFVSIRVHSWLKINPVFPINPVKNNIVKNGACAHTPFMQNEPNSNPAKSSQVLISSSLRSQASSLAKPKNEPKRTQFFQTCENTRCVLAPFPVNMDETNS